MRKIIFIVLAAFSLQVPSYACTSIIISGKVTPDGRPLMWKNRDTKAGENHVQFFPAGDGKYACTGIVNSRSKNSSSIWIGTNSEGFSIMNTLSYNIATAKDDKSKASNGSFMRKVLQKCATLADFEAYLDTLPKPWNMKANIGIIDAKGGAAYYEINFSEYFKYDVNEAPSGWIVRTNYSEHGRPQAEGQGHVRAMTMEKVASAAKSFTPEFIQTNMARSYENVLLGINYRDSSRTSEWAVEHDIVTRYKSASSVVVQGVKPGENPEFTTMWTIIGYPGTTVAMPVWESLGEDGIPALLKRSSEGYSELSHWGLQLKKRVYCYDIDNRQDHHYFKWSLLWNKDGSGFLQKILQFEPDLLNPYAKALDKWRRKGKINPQELKALNERSCESVREFYKKLL